MMRKMGLAPLFWITAPCFGQSVCPKHIETSDYPPPAVAAMIQGSVPVRVTLDAQGNVTKAEVADNLAHSRNPTLQHSTIQNMMHWAFEKPPSAPFTLVITYEYKMDNSLPLNDHLNPVTKVNIDLPDRVTILHNVAALNPAQGKKKPKSSAR